MTEWEPATEAEVAMRDALRAKDQELYFRILSRADLLLPVAAPPVPGATGRRLGHLDHRRPHPRAGLHLPAALRACLGEHAGSTRRVLLRRTRRRLARPEWWLAVNPGLPIEGYLPAWFVAQLSAGRRPAARPHHGRPRPPGAGGADGPGPRERRGDRPAAAGRRAAHRAGAAPTRRRAVHRAGPADARRRAAGHPGRRERPTAGRHRPAHRPAPPLRRRHDRRRPDPVRPDTAAPRRRAARPGGNAAPRRRPPPPRRSSGPTSPRPAGRPARAPAAAAPTPPRPAAVPASRRSAYLAWRASSGPAVPNRQPRAAPSPRRIATGPARDPGLPDRDRDRVPPPAPPRVAGFFDRVAPVADAAARPRRPPSPTRQPARGPGGRPGRVAGCVRVAGRRARIVTGTGRAGAAGQRPRRGAVLRRHTG